MHPQMAHNRAMLGIDGDTNNHGNENEKCQSVRDPLSVHTYDEVVCAFRFKWIYLLCHRADSLIPHLKLKPENSIQKLWKHCINIANMCIKAHTRYTCTHLNTHTSSHSHAHPISTLFINVSGLRLHALIYCTCHTKSSLLSTVKIYYRS